MRHLWPAVRLVWGHPVGSDVELVFEQSPGINNRLFRGHRSQCRWHAELGHLSRDDSPAIGGPRILRRDRNHLLIIQQSGEGGFAAREFETLHPVKSADQLSAQQYHCDYDCSRPGERVHNCRDKLRTSHE